MAKYVFLLVLATLIWGGNFVIGRAFAGVLPPFTLAFFRWTIAVLFFLPFGWKQLTEAKALWFKHWKIILGLSLSGIAGFNTLLYIAVNYTTSINAALVNTSCPVVIMLLSFLFLKERYSAAQYIGIVTSLTGVLWIISGGSWQKLASFSFNVGDLWMIAAILSWCVYSILVKKYAHRFPVYGCFLATMLVGAAVLFPFAAAEWWKGIPIVWSVKSAAGLVYIGLLASIVAFLSWNHAVSEIGPGKAAPFLNLIPVFASTFAILFLNEALTLSQIVGGFMVLSGVSISSNFIPLRFGKRSAAKQTQNET